MHESYDAVVAKIPHDRWAHYERQALYYLAGRGHDVRDLRQVGSNQPDRLEKYRDWLAESCIFALREVRRGNTVLALRATLQMAEYSGHVDGWPTPYMSDAFSALRNHIECVIRGGGIPADVQG